MPQRAGHRLQRAEQLERRSRGSTRRVLVVEEDRPTAFAIQRHLEGLGHDVVLAYTAETAIELAGATACDLVVIDTELRGPIDGDDVARTIHDTLATPIVFIVKPVDPRELEAQVMNALES